jgi:hypothetical protein
MTGGPNFAIANTLANGVKLRDPPGADIEAQSRCPARWEAGRGGDREAIDNEPLFLRTQLVPISYCPGPAPRPQNVSEPCSSVPDDLVAGLLGGADRPSQANDADTAWDSRSHAFSSRGFPTDRDAYGLARQSIRRTCLETRA